MGMIKGRLKAHPPSHKAMAGQVAHGSGRNIKIKQFRYSLDNLGYLVYTESVAVAIDGGAVDEVLNFVKSNNIELKYITNTHNRVYGIY
jgi:hypothetical protein